MTYTQLNPTEIAKHEHNEAENAKNVFVVNPSEGSTAYLQKFAYNGTDLEYIGKNVNVDALDSDTNWKISKLTYTSGDITLIETRTGAWEDRATLF